MTAQRRTHGTGSLLVRTDAAGRESWYGKWRHDGRQIYRKIGPRSGPGGLNKRTAEARLRELMLTVTSDEVLPRASQATTTTAGRTLVNVWEAFEAERGPRLKASTITDYRSCVRNWLLPHFALTPVRSITTRQVDGLITAMATGRIKHRSGGGDGLRPKSVRNHIATLSTLLNFAVAKGWATKNAANGALLPVDGEAERAEELCFLRVHEVHDLAAAAGRDEVYGSIDAALVVTAAMTGLRQGELLALRWESVDLAAGRIRVVRNYVRGVETTPKSKKQRSVPMAPAVAAALLRLAPDDAPPPSSRVFSDPHHGGPLARTALMERYRVALAAAGLDVGFRFHDLRHTMGTVMAAAGEPVTAIQRWMGHSDLKTTERYMHYAPAHDERQRVARAFADPRDTAVAEDVRVP